VLDAQSRSAVARLVEVAEGNPLFVEELTASLVEGAQRSGELPTTVKSAIASRLDALPPDARALLLDASVIGKSFWRGALQAIGAAYPIDEALEALEARDLVRREPLSRVRGDTEFTFKHMLIRDVAYATLPRGARRERHAAVARYIEEAGPEQAKDLAWLLAHHWREAGEPAKAIDYLLLAAEAARDSWATEETIRLFETALDLATDEETRARIRLLRGLALVRLEEYERAETELGELLPELEGLDELEAVLGRGRAAEWTEQTDLALEMAERAIALAERLDARELLGPAHGRLSQAYAMRGDDGDLDRAKETGDRALEIWIPTTRTNELAEHNFMHAHTHYWIGGFDRALELSRAARELAVQSGSREALLRGGALEGASLAAMGRYEEALSAFDERIALGRELGRPVRVLLNYSTTALRDLYDLDEARRRNEEASEEQGWSSFNMPWQNALVDLVFNDLLAGDIASAEARWPKVWDDVRAGKAWQRWFLVGKMTAARAEIALHTEGVEAAADWAQKAIDLAVPVGRLKYETLSRILLAEALLAMGRTQEAVAELQTAARDADRLGSPPGRWKSRAALGRALYAMGRDDEAERAFHEASDLIQNVAKSLSPERAASFLNAAPILEVLKGNS